MNNNRFLFAVLVFVLLALTLATSCAPKAIPAAPAPAATPRVAPTSPTPAATPTPRPAPARPAWQAEWEETLVGARKEGKVVIYGPPGPEMRRLLTEEFHKAYPGISVEYTPQSGSELPVKVQAERRVGLYLADLFINGAGTMLSVKDAAVPIKQFLILPEVKDGKNWQGGKFEFCDREEELALVFASLVNIAMAYNPNLLEPAKAAEMSFWDLAKPEWKGKIVMGDPRVSGPSRTVFHFAYRQPQLGRDYLRALAKNEPMLGRDFRLLLEWVGRGKYPVLLGADPVQSTELIKLGLPIQLQPELKEGSSVTQAWAVVVHPDRVPHPNAAKIYLNWLLSKDGQIVWSKAAGQPSLRLDVATEGLAREVVPKPGVTYAKDYREEVFEQRPEVVKFAQELFGK